MSGLIATLDSEMAARWAALGYTTTPLIYDFNEVVRLRDLDAVSLGCGRVVWHWGAYASPEAAAGDVRPGHPHTYPSGRSVATSADAFTVHCHGYNPTFPDAGATGATAAHEDVAWRLLEMFFGALKWVASKNRLFVEARSKTLVRDASARRFGELVRFDFSILSAFRADPKFSLVNPEPKPTGEVIGASGDITKVVEVP